MPLNDTYPNHNEIDVPMPQNTGDIQDTGTVSTGDRLSFTLFLAIAVHAMLIFGVSFKINSGEQVAPTLNITLATHKANAAPQTADFLAQFNQEASGTSEEVRELTTRQKAEFADTHVRDVTPMPQQKATEASEQKKRVLTTTAANERNRRRVDDKQETDAEREQQGGREDTALVNPEIASLQAKLDRLRQDIARQPRIRRLTSVATKASHDAEYLNAWTQKIEQVGNDNFPEAAVRNGIFGDLRLAVSLYPNGHVADVEVLQSSGHKMLDDAAVQIVRLASPFAPFPPEIRKNTDRLEIIRTWRFEIRGLRTTSG